MPEPHLEQPGHTDMETLSRLLLPLGDNRAQALAKDTSFHTVWAPAEWQALVQLANSNHVVVRALSVLAEVLRLRGDHEGAARADAAVTTEEARIDIAVARLQAICAAFGVAGLDITVIKSLDHWPDLGSDLDLFTTAEPVQVIQLMQAQFGAQLAPRSWGDRLAQKWNFIVPGLPEYVEIHVQRLGQTGEQQGLPTWLPGRAWRREVGGWGFPVAHASDRLMISTLQRMYRHFYFRLCDVIDSASLVRSGAVDFADLERKAREAGIWEGVATYLAIVSDYGRKFGDQPLSLPPAVHGAARFGGAQVYYKNEFLRVPLLPQSAKLLARQYARLLGSGALQSSARLSLLPGLAVVALLEHKRTGSDKGIW